MEPLLVLGLPTGEVGAYSPEEGMEGTGEAAVEVGGVAVSVRFDASGFVTAMSATAASMRASLAEQAPAFARLNEAMTVMAEAAQRNAAELADFLPALGQQGFTDPATADTSQPYFLDLIARIDDVTR